MRPGGTVRKNQFQFTERSFAACNTYNCYCQHYLQSNSKNVRTSAAGDNFKLNDLKLLQTSLSKSTISPFYLLAIYAGTHLGRAGPRAILVLGAPSRCDQFARLSEKRESMPLLCVVPPQKSIFCCAYFGFTFALDVQQKVKLFLHSSKEQMALRSFLGIYSSFV